MWFVNKEIGTLWLVNLTYGIDYPMKTDQDVCNLRHYTFSSHHQIIPRVNFLFLLIKTQKACLILTNHYGVFVLKFEKKMFYQSIELVIWIMNCYYIWIFFYKDCFSILVKNQKYFLNLSEGISNTRYSFVFYPPPK